MKIHGKKTTKDKKEECTFLNDGNNTYGDELYNEDA